ncbi:alpha/beta hydrolase [Paludibacter sp.]|uniref:alpha/beta hydrolase n=1 Tax=Paludibacter sp. TaxID=1898105 RepID=UPI0013525869|nr:alpha/beta hydrolase [Paludibacter sp.]MTK53062.1 alpha/beta hydrolase [Paludibacter sp.]
MKKLKRFLVWSAIIFIVVLAFGSVYMLNISIKSKVEPNDEKSAYEYITKHDYLKSWVDSLRSVKALKDTFIISSDNEKLHALYVESPVKAKKTALIIHGYTDNSIRMLMIGYLYHKKLGFNILLPDLRGQGKSDGKYIQMGWKDRLDILKWIDVVQAKFGSDNRIVIHGISMGAATTMMTSGETLDKHVKCFVEDCGFTSVWDEFSYKLKKEYHMPSFPLLYTTSLYCKLKLGWSFGEASAINQVKKCRLPMFFIHGGSDTYVPTKMVYELYQAKLGVKELWITPKVTHAQSYWDYTDEYTEKTCKFVSKYI